ncbi:MULTISPECIES: hypothetical protein [Xanthomonas]|uniref:HNH endonuclease n=1 Tax=Xanthomonas cucurbitae TaxID=56453 RepID=A0ABY7YA03_9XANT|nr:hypothetical protein [Xanthomonas cucurbitae]QHG89153.1 hypothetical protein EBN15_14085 [Xanthomonas cucurbitae]WDM66765.1 hypothetical protein K6981_14760 [Xanthomonas cucurbitae]WDM70642.1 hypothetical protein K6978_14730 [Xanthomonas cucurbitae]WDM74509.1 hypothetical protein K6982_14050 [Xanthomonas cucurbitae]
MIPVDARLEPRDFERKVRTRGIRSMRRKRIDPDVPLPAGQTLSPFWRECLDDLYREYNQTCAYLAVRIERAVGGVTADHFVAKSKLPGQAYEWMNFRLASAIVNARKCDFEDVLDPFVLPAGWFRLELVTGQVYPSSDIDAADMTRVVKTIERVGLDNSINREMRARHFQEYFQGDITANFLQRYSPFVHAEAERQGLL